MNLHHLCSAPHVEVYFDKSNNWLFIDWEGELTLPDVQHACLEIARCYLTHSYPRVLNSNAHVTSISPDVSVWLAGHLLPALGLAGVEQFAWVVAQTLRGRKGALDAYNRLPHMSVNLFYDIEQAVAWLKQVQPAIRPSSFLLPRPFAPDAQLHHVVNAFARELNETSCLPA
jgi:hypothetical protein